MAELDVPQSSILSLESVMPWPNLQLALENQEMTEKAMKCYSAQLYFRKQLNNIHTVLYGPGKEDGKFQFQHSFRANGSRISTAYCKQITWIPAHRNYY